MPKPRRIYKVRYPVPQPPDARSRTRSGPWWDWYNGYLRSEVWAEVRRRVLVRAKGTCQDCRTRPAAEVHHLTYIRVGRECWGDLQAVCLECHDRTHR